MSGRYIRKAEAHLHPEAWNLQQQRYRKYRAACVVNGKSAQRTRKWRRSNPERARELHRKSERKRKLKRYGLTELQYNDMLAKQNNLCAICFCENKTTRDWHVDHCHTTGKVRGILCHHCNLLLGNARDNQMILNSASKYLENFL